jgi:hypothetical protein
MTSRQKQNESITRQNEAIYAMEARARREMDRKLNRVAKETAAYEKQAITLNNVLEALRHIVNREGYGRAVSLTGISEDKLRAIWQATK